MRHKLSPEALEFFRKQGAKGGKIGGKARSESLTPERRSEIATMAVQAREAKRKKKTPKVKQTLLSSGGNDSIEE